MNRLAIRWQFTLWFGATLALILVGFSALLFAIARHELLAAVDGGLNEELREILNEISLSKTVPELMEHTRQRFSEHGVYHFQMTSTTGTVKFESSTLQGKGPLQSPVDSQPDSPRFAIVNLPGIGACRIVATRVNGPGGPYVVRAATSLAPFDRQLSFLLTVLLASAPVAMVLGIAGGYTLSRRALSPVDRIVDVANRITATDLQQRVEVLNPRDELGRLAQTFNALIDRLQKAIEEMRRFTADAAHELRTPLAVLRSEIDVALRSPRTAHEYRQALETASEEARRLTHLADQLLFLSRQDAGMLQMTWDDVRLDAVLKDVVEQLAPRALEQGVDLVCKDVDPSVIRGDDVRLSQVFYNIVENGIKYTPRGGTVSVKCHAAGDRVVVEFVDTGCGIAPEHLPHLFKRFYRADPGRNGDQGGTGLGLAIAQSAVMAQAGTIDLESVVAKGTKVRVEFPRCPIAPEPLLANAEAS